MEGIIVLAGGWLLSPIVLLIAWLVTRSKLNKLREERGITLVQHAKQSARPGADLSIRDMDNLVLLRLQFSRQLEDGTLEQDRYDKLCLDLDELWDLHLRGLLAHASDYEWDQRLEAAWKLLVSRQDEPPGTAPWVRESQTSTEPPATEAAPYFETPPPPPIQIRQEIESPPLTQASAPAKPTPMVTEQQFTGPSPIPSQSADADDNFAWQPAEPSALEKLMHAMSGWGKLAAPFLVQNIGWFIGGFCFIAGTIFLVSYTSGFINALTIFASLLVYTGFLFGAGYQIRAKRPELTMSSTMLLGIAMLLVPLTITAATRLIGVALPSVPLLLLSIALAALVIPAFYYAANLAGGVLDRALQGGHPRTFMALASLQLAAPLVVYTPSWPLLAGLHALILGITAYGLIKYVREWGKAIFVDRNMLAVSAGGLLIFAALVSFVHLTAVFPASLPRGYYGPFLMALCGVLFYMDSALKQWHDAQPHLSRFTFAIYGLSALALALCIEEPIARLLTLALGVGIYALVTFKYLTLPPLYPMLACLGGLYGLTILANVPHEYWLMAAAPGLIGLLFLIRRFQDRSKTIAMICLSVFATLLAGLTAWTLFNTQPGWTALGLLLIASGLVWSGLDVAKQLLAEEDVPSDVLAARISHTAASPYTLTALAALGVAYAPRLPGLTWETQFALGLIFLALVWGVFALGRRASVSQPMAQALANSGLLNLLLAVTVPAAFVAAGALPSPSLIFTLGLSAAVLAWVAISLRLQPVVYTAVLCAAVAGAVLKHSYFPAPSSGLTQMILVIAVWMLLWWLERMPKDLLALRREQSDLLAEDQPPFMVLGKFVAPLWLDAMDVVRTPARQTMAVLWLFGLVVIGTRLFDWDIGGSWPWAALAGTLATMVVIGYFRLYLATPLAVFLGLCAVLGMSLPETLAAACTIASIYLILVWRLALLVASRPGASRWVNALGFAQQSDWPRLERGIHIGTLMLVVLTTLTVVLWALGLLLFGDYPELELLLPLAPAGAYFVIVGRHYRWPLHSYLALSTFSVGTLAVSIRAVSGGWVGPNLIASPAFGMTLTLLSITFLACSILISRLGNADGFHQSLYRKPLRVSSIVLALTAVVQQMYSAIEFGYTEQHYLSALVLLISGASILLSNSILHWRWAAYAGVGILALSAFAFVEAWVLPRLPGEFALTLAILAFALASLGRYLHACGQDENIHVRPLYLFAAITYAMALVSTVLARFEGTSDHGHVAAAIGVLTLAVFPLACAVSGAALIRGIAVPLLLGALVIVVVNYSLDPALAVFSGFAFWVIGNLVLPRFNASFPQWAVSSGIWPWLGLICVCIGVIAGILFYQMYWLWLAAASAYAFVMLRNHENELWIVTGVIVAYLSSLAVWLIWVPEQQIVRLLPWYALQTACVFLLLVHLHKRLNDKLSDETKSSLISKANSVIKALAPIAVVAGIAQLVMHGMVVFLSLEARGQVPWLFGMTDIVAVAAALVLLILPMIRNLSESSNQERRIYGLAALIGAFAMYLRMVWLGLAPATATDTAALIGAAYATFIAHRLTGFKPLFNIALILPLLALPTVPLHAGSGHAAIALIASAGLYMMMRGLSKRPIPLYLGVLAVNAGVYLWAPLWAKQFGLLQLYAIPAAVSVLILLQMHRRELRQNVLNGTRLGALSVIYASAGADMFIHPGLGIFALALGIGIIGTVVAIGLRIRIFLYASVAFLVLTVLGQLTQFYPDQQLGRALILMGLGIAITAGMVGFNMKREQILQRVRVFRTDLESWN